MRVPSDSDVRDLLTWAPPGGVVSIYVDLRPEDRGEPWRIELRNGLDAVVDQAAGRVRAPARGELEATARRIHERFPADAAHPSGRTRIGFVEVAAKARREEWFAVQAPVARTDVTHSRRPFVAPLVALLDGAAPRGVAVVSAERVRLFRWTLGATEEVATWDLEIFSRDWRERKAQRPGDPARVQGAKASGRDQFDQRLEANRERFLREAGRLAADETAAAGCRELLAFGDPEHVRLLDDGASDRRIEVTAVDAVNLVSEPAGSIAAETTRRVLELARRRELELVHRVKGDVGGGAPGARGLQETLQVLAEGRVEHLVLSQAAIDAAAPDAAAAAALGSDAGDDLPLGERVVELALETSAQVTFVEAEAAEELAEVGGVGALLRY